MSSIRYKPSATHAVLRPTAAGHVVDTCPNIRARNLGLKHDFGKTQSIQIDLAVISPTVITSTDRHDWKRRPGLTTLQLDAARAGARQRHERPTRLS